MLALKIILGVLYILVCLAVVIITLLQDTKEDGISALGGKEASIFNKKNDSKEAFLARITVILGIIFAVLAIALTIIIAMFK